MNKKLEQEEKEQKRNGREIKKLQQEEERSRLKKGRRKLKKGSKKPKRSNEKEEKARIAAEKKKSREMTAQMSQRVEQEEMDAPTSSQNGNVTAYRKRSRNRHESNCGVTCPKRLCDKFSIDLCCVCFVIHQEDVQNETG